MASAVLGYKWKECTITPHTEDGKGEKKGFDLTNSIMWGNSPESILNITNGLLLTENYSDELGGAIYSENSSISILNPLFNSPVTPLNASFC